MNRREELNRIPGVLVGGDFANEADHFFECTDCGQAVDCRRLGDVVHHAEPGHAPIPADA